MRTWRKHREALEWVASLGRARWEDRLAPALVIQTWVRLHMLNSPRSRAHFRGRLWLAKVEAEHTKLTREWRGHVDAARAAATVESAGAMQLTTIFWRPFGSMRRVALTYGVGYQP